MSLSLWRLSFLSAKIAPDRSRLRARFFSSTQLFFARRVLTRYSVASRASQGFAATGDDHEMRDMPNHSTAWAGRLGARLVALCRRGELFICCQTGQSMVKAALDAAGCSSPWRSEFCRPLVISRELKAYLIFPASLPCRTDLSAACNNISPALFLPAAVSP